AALDDLDPEVRRKCEIAAEDAVIAYETRRGFECERVGHLKIGFDVRSTGPADPQTGYRDPVTGIRRIEVKGRRRGQPVRLTTNEWYKATQLGASVNEDEIDLESGFLIMPPAVPVVTPVPGSTD